jgi:hypothetical protein
MPDGDVLVQLEDLVRDDDHRGCPGHRSNAESTPLHSRLDSRSRPYCPLFFKKE